MTTGEKLFMTFSFVVLMSVIGIWGCWLLMLPPIPVVRAELEYVTVNGQRFKRVDGSPRRFKAEVSSPDLKKHK